ncbi:hypothetical protein QQ045_029598 [Rhodiola kirilowii]
MGAGPVLFSTTISRNILYGREDADVDQVIEAAQAANAHSISKAQSLLLTNGALLLLSIQALLSSPEPGDPQDALVAKQYLQDYQTFLGTARYWTEAFAKPLGAEEKVKKIVEMGFPESLVRSTLEAVGGDENLGTRETLLGLGCGIDPEAADGLHVRCLMKCVTEIVFLGR